MDRLLFIITALLVACLPSGAAAESTMTRSNTHLNVPADFQGIVIDGPAEVTFQKKTVARPAWDRSGGEMTEHFGGLNIEG